MTNLSDGDFIEKLSPNTSAENKEHITDEKARNRRYFRANIINRNRQTASRDAAQKQWATRLCEYKSNSMEIS